MGTASVRRTLPLVLLLAALVPRSALAATCASGPSAGGDWPSYGHDLSNTRSQDQEHVISTANVGSLQPAWTFSSTAAGDPGGVLDGTPVEADGCVFAGSSGGRIFALDADTGALIWSTSVTAAAPGGLSGGAIVGSVSVVDGTVYAMVNSDPDPYAIALDESTGEVRWTTVVDHFSPSGTQINASPVIFDNVFFFAEAGPDANPQGRPNIVLLDATTGEILVKTPTVSDADFAAGYAGGGIWGTAVVDPVNKYAYVGTSNPYSKTKEPRYSNALIKVDIDRSRATFGQIVGGFKGETDHYVAGLDRQPACETVGPTESSFSATCVQLDLDFGASPNLFRNAQGDLLVGCLQKSGVYHAVYADTMEFAWQTTAGSITYGAGNADSSAFDGHSIYVGGNPGTMMALTPDDGSYRWASPTSAGVVYEPVSVANGVAYQVDTTGNLRAVDTATGAPLLARAVSADTGDPTAASEALGSVGVAIARNTVYVEADGRTDGWIVAYRPGTSPLPA